MSIPSRLLDNPPLSDAALARWAANRRRLRAQRRQGPGSVSPPLPAKTPAERRAFLIHYAKVQLREAIARRDRQRGFAADLLAWAGKARREAMAIDLSPRQGKLF